MPMYAVRVTESIDHLYYIEASSEEDALTIYYSYDSEQISALDMDGSSSWDTPWDVGLAED